MPKGQREPRGNVRYRSGKHGANWGASPNRDLSGRVDPARAGDADDYCVTRAGGRRATGHEWESEFAHIISLRDGRWLHLRDFANSALAAEPFTG